MARTFSVSRKLSWFWDSKFSQKERFCLLKRLKTAMILCKITFQFVLCLSIKLCIPLSTVWRN